MACRTLDPCNVSARMRFWRMAARTLRSGAWPTASLLAVQVRSKDATIDASAHALAAAAVRAFVRIGVAVPPLPRAPPQAPDQPPAKDPSGTSPYQPVQHLDGVAIPVGPAVEDTGQGERR